MLRSRLPKFVADSYECHEWRHASAILSQDFPQEWQDLLDVLTVFRLQKSWITTGGGNKSQLSAFIDAHLFQRGWVLLPRIEGGGGAGCPLLVFGITKALYVEDVA